MLLKCKPSLPGASSKAGEERREGSPRLRAENKHMLIQGYTQSHLQRENRKNQNTYKHISLIIMPSTSSLFFLTPTKQASIIISQINSHMHHITINTSFCSRLITFIYIYIYIYIAIATSHLTSFSHTFLFSERMRQPRRDGGFHL